MEKTEGEAEAMERFFEAALCEAQYGSARGQGGPFGAVVIREGMLISRAHNTVLSDRDPTAHAEINAIREACRILGRHDLSDCTLITTCEPCPMCLGAILWARIPTVLYGAGRGDAATIGFDDEIFYRILKGEAPSPVRPADAATAAQCRAIMTQWSRTPHTLY